MAKETATDTPRKVRDPELKAIDKCTELLMELDDEQKRRALGYLNSKFRMFMVPADKPAE